MVDWPQSEVTAYQAAQLRHNNSLKASVIERRSLVHYCAVILFY